MVQIFREDAPLSAQMGQMLGQGISQGIAQNLPNPQLQLQGRQQQQALRRFEGSITGTETPAQLSMKWAQNMAGIPGADQLANQILPQYQQQSMVNLWQKMNEEGQQPQAGVGAQPATTTQATSPQAGTPPMMPPVSEQRQGQNAYLQSMMSPSGQHQQQPQPMMQPQQQRGGGLSPQLLWLSQMTGIDPAKLIALQKGVPEAQSEAAVAQAQQQQQAAQQSITENIENLAKSRYGLKEGTDRARFMQIYDRYKNLPTEDALKETYRDYQKADKALKDIRNANIPGFLHSLTGEKEQALKNLQGKVKTLVDLGLENEVRSLLDEQWLSPTEIEMVVRPLDESALKGKEKLRIAPYVEPGFYPTDTSKWGKPVYEQWRKDNPQMAQKMTESYADYLLNNIKPGVSLLGARGYLRDRKGLDYQQYNEALDLARQKGLQLTAEQENELAELTYAPRDSLPYLFQGWNNWFRSLRGQR